MDQEPEAKEVQGSSREVKEGFRRALGHVDDEVDVVEIVDAFEGVEQQGGDAGVQGSEQER